MKSYYLEEKKTHKRYSFKAENRNELKKKMIEKCPNGTYYVQDDKGQYLNNITINSYSRPVLSKADYDNLYFYVTEMGQKRIEERSHTPQEVSSPRRYNTISEVRKAALSKSYENYRYLKNGYIGEDRTVILYVYKGNKRIGEVYCSPLEKPPYKGTGVWVEYVRPNGGMFMIGNRHRLFKDGSIEKV